MVFFIPTNYDRLSTIYCKLPLTFRSILTLLEPIDANIARNFSVNSLLECAHRCRAEKTCYIFKHKKVDTDDEVNCLVTTGEPEYLAVTKDNDANDQWTMYAMKAIVTVLNHYLLKFCYGCHLILA